MWGKVLGSKSICRSHRITPTRVGKSIAGRRRVTKERDHPPRVWGKGVLLHSSGRSAGSPPTRVGKRLKIIPKSCHLPARRTIVPFYYSTTHAKVKNEKRAAYATRLLITPTPPFRVQSFAANSSRTTSGLPVHLPKPQQTQKKYPFLRR